MCAVFEIGAELLFAALSSKAHYSSQVNRDRVACLCKAEIWGLETSSNDCSTEVSYSYEMCWL